MSQATVRSLLARQKRAQSVANEWRDILDDVYEFAIPQRNIINRQHPGQKKGTKVFDSTAVKSTMNFANRIQSDMMPPFQRWVNLVPGPEIADEIKDEAREILGDVSEKLFSVISQSNFDSALNEMLIDLATGTGAMLIQGGTDRMPVTYTAIPIAQLALEEGTRQTIEGIYRTHKLKARLIKTTWPDASIPETIQALIDQESKDPDVELIEATYFDEDDDIWRYEILYGREKVRLVERESRESPMVVPRWMKVAGETFGRGPLIQALPDIKTLNALTKMVLQNASLAIAGAYMVADDGVVNPNTISIAPGAFVPVSRTAGPNGPTIAPIPRSGDFNVAELERDKLITSIKQVLFDEGLPVESAAVRSATEIIARIKELSRSIGAPFGRLMNEFVTPMVKRTLEVMEKAEIIQDRIEVDGTTVQVGVLSPLAQEQALADVEAVARWMEIMLATVGQQTMMLGAKVEDIPEYLGEKLGVPSDLMRTDSEREQLQEKLGQAMAAQAQEQGVGAAVEQATG